MKRIYLLGVFSFFTCVLNAQDIIVMKNGDVVQSKVQEITQTEIKYKKFSNLTGPTYTVDKTTVLSINYENGEKEMINSTESSPVKQQEIVDNSISREENEKLKEKYNVAVWVDPAHVEDEKKKNDKDTKSFYCQFYFTSDAVLADKNIEVEFQSVKCEYGKTPYSSSLWCANNQGMQLTIKNKTNKVIFIDLANTFFIRGSEAAPYYIPTSTSNTNVGTTGASINLGYGIKLGGASTNAQTTVTYSQRTVSVPPMSSKKLEPMLIVTPDTKDAYEIKVGRYDVKNGPGYCPYFQSIGMKRGEIYEWTEDNSKFKITSFVTYSFEENMEKTQSVKTGLYANKLIALPRPVGGYPVPTANIILTENFQKSLYFLGEFR